MMILTWDVPEVGEEEVDLRQKMKPKSWHEKLSQIKAVQQTVKHTGEMIADRGDIDSNKCRTLAWVQCKHKSAR